MNDKSGTSAGEIEIEALEEIVKVEKSLDETIEEADQETTHVINETFDHINITIEVTPFSAPPEKPESTIAESEEVVENIHTTSPAGLANPNEEDVLSDPALMEEALREAEENQDEKDRQEFEHAVAVEVKIETQTLQQQLE